MKRFCAFLAATLLATGVVVASSVSPATAKVCAGQGRATLRTGIGLPVVGAKKAVTFSIAAPCANGGSISASGTLANAACGKSNGTGTVNGKAFKIDTAGSLIVLQPRSGSAVRGVGNAVSDPRVANNSCASKTARVFLVTAAASY